MLAMWFVVMFVLVLVFGRDVPVLWQGRHRDGDGVGVFNAGAGVEHDDGFVSLQPSCGSQCVDRGEAGCSFWAYENTLVARQLLLCEQQFLVGNRDAGASGLSQGI
jgi:hypothetical protein